MQTLTATPTKLRTGNWGARVNGPTTEGDTITVTTRAGKSWTTTVAKVVWTNGTTAIVATGAESHPRAPHRTSPTTGADVLDCGHRTDRPARNCDFCRLGIGA